MSKGLNLQIISSLDHGLVIWCDCDTGPGLGQSIVWCKSCVMWVHINCMLSGGKGFNGNEVKLGYTCRRCRTMSRSQAAKTSYVKRHQGIPSLGGGKKKRKRTRVEPDAEDAEIVQDDNREHSRRPSVKEHNKSPPLPVYEQFKAISENPWTLSGSRRSRTQPDAEVAETTEAGERNEDHPPSKSRDETRPNSVNEESKKTSEDPWSLSERRLRPKTPDDDSYNGSIDSLDEIGSILEEPGVAARPVSGMLNHIQGRPRTADLGIPTPHQRGSDFKSKPLADRPSVADEAAVTLHQQVASGTHDRMPPSRAARETSSRSSPVPTAKRRKISEPHEPAPSRAKSRGPTNAQVSGPKPLQRSMKDVVDEWAKSTKRPKVSCDRPVGLAGTMDNSVICYASRHMQHKPCMRVTSFYDPKVHGVLCKDCREKDMIQYAGSKKAAMVRNTNTIQEQHSKLKSFCETVLWRIYCELPDGKASPLVKELTAMHYHEYRMIPTHVAPTHWVEDMSRTIMKMVETPTSQQLDEVLGQRRDILYREDGVTNLRKLLVWSLHRGPFKGKRQELGMFLEVLGLEVKGTFWKG